MIDPGIGTALTRVIETTVNMALRYDPASRQQLAQLTNVLAIESTTSNITLYCQGSEQGLKVMSYCELPVTTHLKGSPLALASLLKQPTSLADSGVELVGSVGLLQQWQRLLQQLDIDWEDAISNILGDYLGPITANSIRSSTQWAGQQHQEHLRLLKEYLPEELKIVPSKTELEQFYSDVTGLALDSERLQARFERLQEKFKASKKSNDSHCEEQ